MNLSQIQIEPRIRNPWDAVDLGMGLTKSWYRSILGVQLLFSLPIFLLATVMLQGEAVLYAFTIVWWLKPLWERLALRYASRALFNEYLSTKEQMKLFLDDFRSGQKNKDLLLWLTIRRFSPTRSFDMPLSLLEGLSGAARKQRMSLLHRNSYNASMGLTIILLHIEYFIVFGVAALAALIVPGEFYGSDLMDTLIQDYEKNPYVLLLLSNIVSYVVIMMVMPFYAVAGFSLYIHRRVELEAWDIEVCFRGIHMRESNRKANPEKTSSAKQLLVFVLSTCLFFTSTINSQPAFAKEPLQGDAEQVYPSEFHSEVKQEVLGLLGGEGFNLIETETKYRLPESEEEEGEYECLRKLFRWLKESSGTEDADGNWDFNIAKLLEFVIWTLMLLGIVYLLYVFRNELGDFVRPKKAEKIKPVTLFDMDIREEKLPEDIPAEVAELWRQGAYREALALLFRATLSRLVHRADCEFSESMTEQECADYVKQKIGGEVASYTQEIVVYWQQTAYAHRIPSYENIDAALQRWNGVYDSLSDKSEIDWGAE